MSKLRISEWHRTIILIILLLIGATVVFWQGENVQDNFVESIETSSESAQ